VSGVFADPRIARGMERQTTLRRTRLSAGGAIAGWKIGFGAPAALQRLRIDKPLIGFVLQAALVTNDGRVSLTGWQKPVAEPEIAVYLGSDLSAGVDDATARQAIAAIGPAIELADIDAPMDDVEAILAGDIFQRHVILGPRDETRAGLTLDGLRGQVTRKGTKTDAPADLESNTGRIIDIVRHAANAVTACGEMLRAGQFIIAGSVMPPLFLEASDEAVSFALEPTGSVSVQFERN